MYSYSLLSTLIHFLLLQGLRWKWYSLIIAAVSFLTGYIMNISSVFWNFRLKGNLVQFLFKLFLREKSSKQTLKSIRISAYQLFFAIQPFDITSKHFFYFSFNSLLMQYYLQALVWKTLDISFSKRENIHCNFLFFQEKIRQLFCKHICPHP